MSETSGPPPPPMFNQQSVNALAVATLIVISAIVGAVWAVDDHFISRREFNTQMRIVSADLRAINARLGIVQPAPYVAPDGDGQ